MGPTEEFLFLQEPKDIRTFSFSSLMSLRVLNYGIEYICFFRKEETHKARQLLETILCQDPQPHSGSDYVVIIDKVYMVNAVHDSPYRFFDSLILPGRSTFYTILRELDECEVFTIDKLVPDDVRSTIDDAIALLERYDIKPTHHGWHKVRSIY